MNTKKLHEIMESAITGTNFHAQYLAPLTEAAFDKPNRTVKVTVIKAGWSKNRVNYPQSVLPQIAEFLNTTARKVYVDHTEMGATATRKIHDWVADVVEAHVEGDAVKATIKVHNSGPYAWLYERMQESDTIFGPSIVGVAEVQEGEADGVRGKIVKAIKYIGSFDIVSSPAAGGTIDAVQESHVWDTPEELHTMEAKLGSYLQTLKDREKKWALADQVGQHLHAFGSMVRDLILAEEDFATVAVADRKAALKEALTDLGASLDLIEYLPPKEVKTQATESGSAVPTGEEITEAENKPNPNKEQELMEFKNLAEFRAKHPELAEAFRAEILEAEKKADLSTELATSKKRVTELEEQVKSLDTEKVQLAAEVKELKEANEAYHAKELEAKKAAIIAECIQTVGVPAEAVTDVFKTILNKVVFESEHEDAFRSEITAQCEDRKSIAVKESANTPAITTGPTKTEPVKETIKKGWSPEDTLKTLGL